MTASFSAPGKAILFGEHAVVYGQPAIAVPLPQLRARALIRPLDSPLKIIAEGAPGRRGIQDPLQKMAEITRKQLGLPKLNGEIRIQSQIPIASGLGSGAAVSAAIGRAAAALAGTAIRDETLNSLVYEIEKLHHGKPSGIDNSVIVFERPLYFRTGYQPEFLRINAPLRLLVADSGVTALTWDAVAHVQRLLQRQPDFAREALQRIGNLVESARRCLETGEQARLGQLMCENHALLRALGLSSPALDALVAAALAGGALGAKLSGAGMGGNIIALTPAAAAVDVEQRLMRAGAVTVISASIGGEQRQA